MAKVNRRGGFSDRNSIKIVNNAIQVKEFDERTRIQLINMISRLYAFVYNNDLYYRRDYIQSFLKYVMRDIYSLPVDSRVFYDDDKVIKMINDTLLNLNYSRG